MKRYFLIIAAIVSIGGSTARAQQPICQAKRAPEYKGFLIGMTLIEVKDTLFDPSAFEMKMAAVNKIGVQPMQIRGSELKDEFAEGIDDINLTFVDGRLAVIKATYNGADSWMGSQDFFKQTSEKLGIPAPTNVSSTRGRGGEKYKVECTGFAAILAYSFGVSPSVTIYDVLAQKLVEERAIKNPDGEVKTITISPQIPVRRQPPFVPSHR